MHDYTSTVTEKRDGPLFSRVTRADLALVRAAAAAEGLSLSSYTADAVTRQARRDLSNELEHKDPRNAQGHD